MLHRFPVIVAPTAGGKSAVAVALAHTLAASAMGPGEIVTADSVQVFRGLDIGSAKPTMEEREGVPHHLIDLVEPDDPQPFTVDRWLSRAEATIAEIRSRGATPIVVGGTNLYVKALLEGLFEGPPADPELRAVLSALSPQELRRRLEAVDPASALRIHPNDVRRTIRALEVQQATGKPISALRTQWDTGQTRDDALLIGLEWPVDLLNRRINARVRKMFELGLVDEVRSLHDAGRLGAQAREALGYKQLREHFEGRCPMEEAVERIKIETRRFAKNQRTWLRRLRMTPGSVWLSAADSEGARSPQMLASQILTSLGAAAAAQGPLSPSAPPGSGPS